MADISALFNQTIPAYQKPEDLDFPVSKIRLFIDVLWQAVTGKTLTDEQKTTLKQLIDLLNLLDEHKHETEKELIAAMLPSISPLLQKMPTLGLTGTHVFAHLVPMYQLYLPTIEQMVKDAHPFSQEETLLYYQTTIFDHLFLVHIFEQEPNANMIEMLLTIKALILTNALVYDYHQHVAGRSISFFTFLMRGGLGDDQLLPFLEKAVNRVKEEAKQTVTNTACLDSLEFLTTKLMDTTKTTTTADATANEQKETKALDDVMQAGTPQDKVQAVFNQATETPVEKDSVPETPAVETTTPPAEPMASTPEPAAAAPEPPTLTTPVAESPITLPTTAPTTASTPSPAVEAAMAENISATITPETVQPPTEPTVAAPEPAAAAPVVPTAPEPVGSPVTPEPIVAAPMDAQPPVVSTPPEAATAADQSTPSLSESPILAHPTDTQPPAPVT